MDHNRVCVWFDSGPTGTGAEIFYPKIPWQIAQEPNSRAPPHRPPGVRGVVLIFFSWWTGATPTFPILHWDQIIK